jgi:hypothetical protein
MYLYRCGKDGTHLLGGWFSALGGFKTLIGAVGLILGVSDVTLPGSPGIVVYQDHFGSHY